MSEFKEQAPFATMLQDHLSSSGQRREALAFERWFNKPLERFSVDQLAVSDARKSLKTMLAKARSDLTVTAIEPHRRKGKTVVVISLDELANTLGAVAADMEKSTSVRGGDPMKMFVAVDRFPEVSEAAAIIEHRIPAMLQPLDVS